eukprot:5117866-Pyramimonas_sp.AAC.1
MSTSRRVAPVPRAQRSLVNHGVCRGTFFRKASVWVGHGLQLAYEELTINVFWWQFISPSSIAPNFALDKIPDKNLGPFSPLDGGIPQPGPGRRTFYSINGRLLPQVIMKAKETKQLLLRDPAEQ